MDLVHLVDREGPALALVADDQKAGQAPGPPRVLGRAGLLRGVGPAADAEHQVEADAQVQLAADVDQARRARRRAAGCGGPAGAWSTSTSSPTARASHSSPSRKTSTPIRSAGVLLDRRGQALRVHSSA